MLMRKVDDIIEKYSSSELKVPDAFSGNGLEPLSARLARAALNQSKNGAATLGRYAIWAETVRDNIIEAINFSDSGQNEKANELLIKAANSLSAFSEIQKILDSE